MPCGLCHNQERSVDERKDYLCGRCVIKLMGMDKRQKRMFIDSLYLRDQEVEAQFVESFFEGRIEAVQEPKEKPKLLKRTGKI